MRGGYSRLANTFPLSIKTPQLRDRKFEKLKLENGLSAFVISDPNTTTVSSALSCNVGSWHDGTYAGTAHFLEHMLFLGTKKYPAPNDYEKFVFDNGGSLNGYTANDHSLYYFNHLSPKTLAGGMDRFARFFYEPNFDPSCVDRERNAVHEEYKKNIESDGWRILHVMKELALKSHPIHQFNTGNLETMTFGRDYLIQWYESTYSAEKMNLVVLGKESISDLTAMTVDAFGPIPKRDSAPQTPPFPSQIWADIKGKVVWIDTIKDVRELSLSWEIPSSFVDLRKKTASILSGILGHEGKQSILQILKEEGLAEGLSAGAEQHGCDNVSFTISISLTKQGIEKWKYVIELVDACLQKLANGQDVPLYLFEETNRMKKIAYEFQQRQADIAINYCEALRKEKIDTFPARSMLIEDFNHAAVMELLKRLLVKECHVIVATKEKPPVVLDKQEKWMFAKYAVFPLDSQVSSTAVTSSLDRVDIPNQNVFIPSQLDLVDRQTSKVPLALHESKGVSLYFFPDHEFQVPEAYYSFTIKTTKIQPNDAASIILANLYLRFVFEELNPLAYDSSIAGLHYNISVSKNNSITLSVNGYSEKCLLLLEKLLHAMKTVLFDQERFEIFRNSLLRKYENAAKNSPVHQSYEVLYHNLLDHHIKNKEMAAASMSVSIQDLEHFKATWFQERIIEAFVGGNVDSTQAKVSLEMIQNSFPGSPVEKKDILEASYLKDALQHPQTSKQSFQVSGNALVHTIDAGARTDELRCHWGILTSLLQEPFYTELRTVQQTGYIVNCSGSQIKKQLFVNAVIQSNKYDPRDLLSRVELFYETFLRQMESPETLDRFAKIRDSSIQKLEIPFDRLSSKMNFYNMLTFEEDGDYDMLQRRLEMLRNVEMADIQKTANVVLGMENRRRMAILATGIDKENFENAYRESGF